ncbi:bifunctional DNA primase/polymerase [Thalassospira sp. 11-3]|uniref:bifunctional DNA primase/polymerase n=1 Tax=Thalassospira sp. 11-3 TaxID=2135614 RepID=UPI000D76CC7D|nr:bifunctional DNA primase/polymerase [Thalassospira sp. 11-3]PXX25582.1 bifunctional DNA primase/polymerase-like protein [Thalassospira sp. 11-3]
MTFIPSDWRFTPLRGKAPFLPDWQNQPHTLNQIDLSKHGVGLLLGPVSGGTAAIDFDGPEAWDFVRANNIPNPVKVSGWPPIWTSGKHMRCQIAVRVPRKYWGVLKSKKLGPNKKLELRWTGCQSAIPPSRHPETGSYNWVFEPTIRNSAFDISDELLNLWLESCEKPVPQTVSQTTFPELPDDEKTRKVDELLTVIARNCPRPDYEDWLKFGFCAAKELGKTDAIAMMRKHFGEEKTGEYDRLFSGHHPSESPTMGTLYHHAKIYEPDAILRSEIHARELNRIKRKYNNFFE